MAMEMPRMPNVLLVEDAPDLAMLYQDYLRDEPINLEHVDTGRAAMAKNVGLSRHEASRRIDALKEKLRLDELPPHTD